MKEIPELTDTKKEELFKKVLNSYKRYFGVREREIERERDILDMCRWDTLNVVENCGLLL